MNNIKRFITKVSSIDNKQGKSVILSIEEARFLRDEIACLLADTLESSKKTPEQIIQVELVGGKF